jgi:phage terminase large subunit-like protein
MEFLFHLTGLYPKWYPEERRIEGPIIARIVAKDFQKGVGEVIIPFLEEWLDPSLIASKYRNPIGIPVKWTLKNGARFDILTHEQNTEQFEGWRGHVAWFDEPPPRDKYIATLRGLVDFRGRNWLTLTPLTQPWIYDEIYTKADDKKVFVVTTDIRDNPHLDPEAIKEFESKLTEEEIEARVHGKFLHLSGLIYKEFDQQIHISEPPKVKDNWTRYFCIDPHPRTPTACLWLAVDPYDNHWIYDELWLKDMDIEQICHAIHAQEGDLKPSMRFMDPAMDKDNELAGGFNTRKEMMKYGIFCQRANTDPNLGMSRIKQALKPKYIHKYGSEMPQLRVSRKCSQTIYEFQHYIWSDRRMHKEYYGEKNSVLKKNDHFMDCLRYIYNAGPRFVKLDEEEMELVYEGEYTKHPTNKLRAVNAKQSYRDLVEG